MTEFIFNIALVQVYSDFFNEKENLKKAEFYFEIAKKNNADLILFPEIWSIGYDNLMNSFKKAKSKTEIKKILEKHAINKKNTFFKSLIKIIKKYEIAMAFPHLYNKENEFFNSVSIIDKNGDVVLEYSKVHTCDFSYESVFTPGDSFPVKTLKTKNGEIKIGAMICYDREFPESARVLMLNGAEIILVPNACPMDENRINQLKSRAFENMTGIAMTNIPGEEHGHSLALDGIAYDKRGKARNMVIIEAGENEGLYMAAFNMDKLRNYRKAETWGNAFRKTDTYGKILSKDVDSPFNNRRKPFLSIK